MGAKKHIPQRTCIACRQVKDKRDLLRVVRTPADTLILDETGKANGRGAYLCKTPACLEKGLTKGFIARALKMTLTEEVMVGLKNYLPTHVSS